MITPKKTTLNNISNTFWQCNVEDIDVVPDELLLNHILSYIRPIQSKELTANMLNRYKDIGSVFNASIENLGAMSDAYVAGYLYSYALVRRKIEISDLGIKQQLHTSDDITKYLLSVFSGVQLERVYLILLDHSDHLLYNAFIGQPGAAHNVTLDLRKLFEIILSYPRCTKVILAHNHPSGTLHPSEDDIGMTLSVKRMLDEFNIKLVDHFIVAGRKVKSIFLSLTNDEKCDHFLR